MYTYTMLTRVSGGWISVVIELVVILVSAIVLFRLLNKRDMGTRDSFLFSLGYFLFNVVAYEILVSLVFFPGSEYYNRGAVQSMIILFVALLIPIVLAIVIAMTIHMIRKLDKRG